MPEISFYEQYEWSASRGAMKFWAVVDGAPMQCWIDEETLNTFTSEDEEDKNVQARFIENQAVIREVAKRMILDGQLDEDKSVSISAANFAPDNNDAPDGSSQPDSA